jgi:YcaO-like protein with predicted kinase domain
MNKQQWFPHRSVAPEVTLDRILPIMESCGITRCTSVTQLDTLGVPTYCSIRPDAFLLQVSNGKGLTDAAAKVSAIMEGIELYHAETPSKGVLRRCSASELLEEGATILHADQIHGYFGNYDNERYRLDWVCGEILLTGLPVWTPASAIYFDVYPSLHQTGTNGLASGNHLAEATLHGLYELIERDAMSRLFEGGQSHIATRAAVIEPGTVTVPELRTIIDQAEENETKVVLLRLESAINLETIWAIFLNTRSFVSLSTFNVGWGTHSNIKIAAARALTEAAQSRLTFIHGGREDIVSKSAYGAKDVKKSTAYQFFNSLKPTVSWSALADETPPASLGANIETNVGDIVRALDAAELGNVYRFDLTHPDKNIAVVKIIAPKLKFNEKLF